MSKVLVTGGSGFIGGHCLIAVLAAGHEARTTVRSLAREAEIRETLKSGGADGGDRLSFVAADLENDAGWPDAVAGCDTVLHVASPFPAGVPRDENELVRPAREGALRVLRAARDAGVKRVVLTSSFAAIGYGGPARAAPYTEADWTDADAPGTQPYVKSKTLAERAAWNFVRDEGGGLELAVVNPVGVFGPALGPDFSTSIQIIQRLMNGEFPGCPRLWFGAVDVRDVADLHVLAMDHPAAAGERFLATAGDFFPLIEMARILKRDMGEAAKRVPTRELPDWMVRLTAMFDPSVRQVLPELGKRKTASNEKARRLLGWFPRSNEEAILATARSLQHLGLLKT